MNHIIIRQFFSYQFFSIYKFSLVNYLFNYTI
nr:MAG TPA: hypothetical protein [Caudoviricetes sp.]